MAISVDYKSTPLKYDDLAAPFKQIKEVYDETQEKYDEVDQTVSTLESQIREGDIRAMQQYKAYMARFDPAIESFSHGMNVVNMSALTGLRHDMYKEITPIATAAQRRINLEDEQRKALSTNPELIYERRASDMSLDTFMDDPLADYGRTINGKELYDRAKDAFDHISKAFGDTKINYQKAPNGALMAEVIKETGLNDDQLNNLLKDIESGDFLTSDLEDLEQRVVAQTAQNLFNQTGVQNWGNPSAELQVRNKIISALEYTLGTREVTVQNLGGGSGGSGEGGGGGGTDILDTEQDLARTVNIYSAIKPGAGGLYTTDDQGNIRATEAGSRMQAMHYHDAMAILQKKRLGKDVSTEEVSKAKATIEQMRKDDAFNPNTEEGKEIIETVKRNKLHFNVLKDNPTDQDYIDYYYWHEGNQIFGTGFLLTPEQKAYYEKISSQDDMDWTIKGIADDLNNLTGAPSDSLRTKAFVYGINEADKKSILSRALESNLSSLIQFKFEEGKLKPVRQNINLKDYMNDDGDYKGIAVESAYILPDGNSYLRVRLADKDEVYYIDLGASNMAQSNFKDIKRIMSSLPALQKAINEGVLSDDLQDYIKEVNPDQADYIINNWGLIDQSIKYNLIKKLQNQMYKLMSEAFSTFSSPDNTIPSGGAQGL